MRVFTTFPDRAIGGPSALPALPGFVPGARCLWLTADDSTALPLLQDALSAEGLAVRATSADDTLDDTFDAVLLWVTRGLAGQLRQLRELRRLAPDRPLLVACSGLRELDQVLALEMGADDVLDTAWSAAVVAARLRARWRVGTPRGDSFEDELQFGALHLVRSERRVAHHGSVVPLTEGEFEVLWLLASHAGSALSRAEILRRVRGLDDQPLDRSIDCRVYRIRAKLGDHERGQHRIRTVRNRGYVFLPAGW